MNKNETKSDIIEYREIHAIVYVPDRWEEEPIEQFEQACEDAGFEVETAQIMDYDDEDEVVSSKRHNIRYCLGVGDDEYEFGDSDWNRYCLYLIRWANYHGGPEYEGMSPACYDEWCDNEKAYEDEMEEEDDE